MADPLLLFSKYDIIWQFIFIGGAVIGKMRLQGITDFCYDKGYSCAVITGVEVKEHVFYGGIPEGGASFLVDAFIGKYRQLVVFNSDVYQYGVPEICLFHFKGVEDLGSAVQRINKLTAAFDVHPYFSAGFLFGSADGIHYHGCIRLGKKGFFSKNGK